MEPPTSRLTRLLVGFILSLMVVVSISILNEDGFSISNAMMAVPTLVAVLAGILLAVVIAGRERKHGNWITDSWISREPEDEMLSRLEKEGDEASMQDLGSKWARMEMDHLESKHGEE
ncbi:MAG TPA: hypothetical protein EYQ11_03170 [Candidatus Poseidoniales archaeon]|nr:MAG: hypothetical protein CXT66_05590 [Euryarchaeota archaeon]HIG33866.1 hypothetical protein [Candidatus Poseidoniales archaeon]HIL67296.1 hypothetical protein [Candidatus Poseidoniales archaeon]